MIDCEYKSDVFIVTVKSLLSTGSALIYFYWNIPCVTNIQTTLTYRRDIKAYAF